MSTSPEDPFTLQQKSVKSGPTIRESDIQSMIMKYLKFSGYDFWRSYVGPIVRGGNGQKKYFTKNEMSGFPDITAFLKSDPKQMICIEVKSEKGYLSKDQKKWKKFLEKHSIPVLVCRSLQETIDALKEMEEEGIMDYL